MHGTRRRRRPTGATLTHYLITIAIGPREHMHGYLMCTGDRRYILEATDRMLNAAEKAGCTYPLMNMILLTGPLTEGIETVREIIGARCPEAKRLIEEAVDYHFSAWVMSSDDPDDAKLMQLH